VAEHGLGRPWSKVIQSTWRAEKIITLLVLFILLTAAASGVTTVLTGPDWALLWQSLLFGLLIGWGLAVLRWPAWRSALLLIGLGILFSLFFAGGLGPKVLAILAGFFRLIGSVPSWLRTGNIDLGVFTGPAQQLFTSLSVVASRVFAWVSDLTSGQAIFDPVAAGIVWSLAVWLVSAWAGWVVEALQGALIAVLPALSLNLITLSYGRSSSISIYLMLGLTLVLIAVVQYSRHRQEWDETRVAYPEHKGRQVSIVSIGMAFVLVVLAALLSSISLKEIERLSSRAGQTASQNQSGLAKSLGIQQPSPVPSIFTQVTSPGLPRELLIGSGPELSHEQVMSVAVSNLFSLMQSGRLPPLYWRSYTYDIYTGHGWSTSPTTQTQYPPGQLIQPRQAPYHQLIEEEVNPVPGQTGTIYAAGEASSVDTAATAAWRSNNDLFGIQTTGSSYTARSLLSMVSADTLQSAGQDYPTWVRQRYLALPAEVTSRVKALAIQLTASEATPFDRAHAIEQYLRTTYPYTTDVPYPPANQDLADYFLFDLRKGYCDYYATAMVVLARAAGLPSRLAIGYASGTYNTSSQRFIVTQADAHSWVEVYFAGIGWVTFEPTAGSPPINRSSQATPQATPTSTPVKVPPNTSSSGPNIAIGVYSSLGIFALVGFTLAIYDEAHLSRLEPGAAAAEIYRRLRRYGTVLKVPFENGQTPNEYALALIQTLQILAPDHPTAINRPILQVEATIQAIVRLSYRPSEAGQALKTQLLPWWKGLRWQLRWMWIRMTWKAGAVFIQKITGHKQQAR
jgi:transglutaminase-like putative cysteine protease